MGFGLPTAIGAALAAPERKVVCISGDGSLLMNIQEMATAAEQGVDVTVILLNNVCLGLVHQQQELFFKANYFSSMYETKRRFPASSPRVSAGRPGIWPAPGILTPCCARPCPTGGRP